MQGSPPQGPEARDDRARCAPSPGSIPGARSRLAQLALAAVVGAAAFWISTLLWPIPAESGNWLIERYEALSLDPFRKTGYSHRILAPLVAHALGLDGDRFRDFTLAFGPILLAGIFLFCRREGLSAAPAGAIVLTFAISRTVGNSNFWPGLTDTLTYTLLLGSLAARRPATFWILALLNLLNHEQALFALPWLLYVRATRGDLRLRTDLALGGSALAAYAAFRASLGSGAIGLHALYVRRPLADYAAEYLLAWWFLWTSFGFLLCCLIAYAASGRARRNAVVLCLLGAAAPYLIAWDPPRYLHLSFGGFLIAAIEVARTPGLRRWIYAIPIGNLAIHLASGEVMRRFALRAAETCPDAADPVRCVHLATMRITIPSLAVIVVMAWLARRMARPRRAAVAVQPSV